MSGAAVSTYQWIWHSVVEVSEERVDVKRARRSEGVGSGVE